MTRKKKMYSKSTKADQSQRLPKPWSLLKYMPEEYMPEGYKDPE
jgi:hypothetical protein